MDRSDVAYDVHVRRVFLRRRACEYLQGACRQRVRHLSLPPLPIRFSEEGDSSTRPSCDKATATQRHPGTCLGT